MRVLIVDDEDVVRSLICSILTRQGYQTIAATSGFEGLEMARQNPCDLVITDIKMPCMDGRELVQRLKEENYPAQYLLISGYAESVSDDLPFLAKPFEAHALIEAVERLIGRPRRSPVEIQERTQRLRKEWLAAMAQQDEVIAESASIPHPDGTLRIEKSGQKRAAAFAKYRDALQEYREALQRLDGPNKPDT